MEKSVCECWVKINKLQIPCKWNDKHLPGKECHKDTYKIKNYSPFSIATITTPHICAIIFPVIVLYSFVFSSLKMITKSIANDKIKK